jgi:hypothetical protein
MASLALARARKTEAFSGRIWCRSEGIPNGTIVTKLSEIHKAKALGWIEFIAFLFSGLRGVCGVQLELIVRVAETPESRRLHGDFRLVPALSLALGSARDDQMRMGITT